MFKKNIGIYVFYLTIIGILGISGYLYKNKPVDYGIGKSVVKIFNYKNGVPSTTGTGFYISTIKNNELVVMTNAHICHSSEDIRIGTVQVSILKINTFTDLCLLTAPKTDIKPLKLATRIVKLEELFVIGFPRDLPKSKTSGYYSGIRNIEISIFSIYTKKDMDKCTSKGYSTKHIGVCTLEFMSGATTIPALPGNSGSPVFNIHNKVVGVVFAISSKGNNWADIVPLHVVKEFLYAY